MENKAYVTVTLCDKEAVGALVLAKSLRQHKSSHRTLCMVYEVSSHLVEALRSSFDCVKPFSLDEATSKQINDRPDLKETILRLQIWRLKFEKCIYLDPSCLVLQSIDELFERSELSASPDTKWPDHFNTGVFVFQPNEETYQNLVKMANELTVVDIQSLLNNFYSDWSTLDIKKHLPFIYNITPNVFYSYQPALKSFKDNVKIVQFSNEPKPWNTTFDVESKSVDKVSGEQQKFYTLWWTIFNEHVKTLLDSLSMQCVKVSERIHLIPYEQAHYVKPQPESQTDACSDRKAWETGQIDYMGKDSFDNIKKMLDKSINE